MTYLNIARTRHAEYYLKRLRDLDTQYRKGGEELLKSMSSFRMDWGQCKRGQTYAAEWIGRDDWATDICLEYALAGATMLSLQLPPQERINWLEPALQAAQIRARKELEAEIWGQLGMANDILEKWELSVRFYKECLTIARVLKDRGKEGRSLGSLGLVYIMLGDPTDAKFSLEQALGIAREIGDREAEGRHLGSLGLMSTGQESIQYFEPALEIARALGDRRGEISHLGCLGMAWLQKGQKAQNMQSNEYILPNIYMRNMRPDGSLPSEMQQKLEAQDSRLCFRKAGAYYEQAVSIAREVGDYLAEGRHLGELGNVILNQGDGERALICYQKALAIAQEIGDRQNEVRQLENMKSAFLLLNKTTDVNRIEMQLKEISQTSGGFDTKDILDKFGSKEVYPFYEDFWKASREEDYKRYWSEYYSANIAG